MQSPSGAPQERGSQESRAAAAAYSHLSCARKFIACAAPDASGMGSWRLSLEIAPLSGAPFEEMVRTTTLVCFILTISVVLALLYAPHSLGCAKLGHLCVTGHR